MPQSPSSTAGGPVAESHFDLPSHACKRNMRPTNSLGAIGVARALQAVRRKLARSKERPSAAEDVRRQRRCEVQQIQRSHPGGIAEAVFYGSEPHSGFTVADTISQIFSKRRSRNFP